MIRTSNANIQRQQPTAPSSTPQETTKTRQSSASPQSIDTMEAQPAASGAMAPGKAPSAAERDPTVRGLEEGKEAAQEEGLQQIMEMLQQLIDMLKQLLEGGAESGEAAGPEGAAAPASEAAPAGAEMDGILEQLLGLADGLEELGGAGADLAKHIRDGVSKISGQSGKGSAA